jgi:hypothetical protein
MWRYVVVFVLTGEEIFVVDAGKFQNGASLKLIKKSSSCSREEFELCRE